MKKTFHGSCHCGDVKFEADLDLAAGTGKCNCSICAKTRYWGAMTQPEDVRLLSDADTLSVYRFGSQSVQHLFCKRCGVRPFLRGEIPDAGAFCSVNLACLDDADPAELADAPLNFADGRNDNWYERPAEVRHL